MCLWKPQMIDCEVSWAQASWIVMQAFFANVTLRKEHGLAKRVLIDSEGLSLMSDKG